MTGCGGPGATPILGLASPANAVLLLARETTATPNIAVHLRALKAMPNQRHYRIMPPASLRTPCTSLPG